MDGFWQRNEAHVLALAALVCVGHRDDFGVFFIGWSRDWRYASVDTRWNVIENATFRESILDMI
jgi:hypothetical protein